MLKEEGATRPDGGSDHLVEVLDGLDDVADAVVADARELHREVDRVRRRRRAGASARDALASEGQPRLVLLVDRLASRVIAASGRLRRVAVAALLGEGERVTAIARFLGVSHQRISSLRGEEAR